LPGFSYEMTPKSPLHGPGGDGDFPAGVLTGVRATPSPAQSTRLWACRRDSSPAALAHMEKIHRPFSLRSLCSLVANKFRGWRVKRLKIRIYPRIAAWPPRGFTPCPSVVKKLGRRGTPPSEVSHSWRLISHRKISESPSPLPQTGPPRPGCCKNRSWRGRWIPRRACA